tara:strand:+ start:16 stop:1095 length:1080 start_codon:yes stop_codon:yes gene_type:complete
MAGKSFLKLGQTGIGTQTTTERNAGVSTAAGTVTFDVTEEKMKIYKGDSDGWSDVTSATLDASGGTEFNAANGKRGYAFTSNGNFVVNSGEDNIEYIIIAGGGGGGVADGGGGGGGGGVMTNIPGIIPAPVTGGTMPITPGTYPVVRANGGAAGSPPANPGDSGDDGGSSSFNSVSAGGGGGGGPAAPTQGPGRAGQPPGGNGGGGGANGNTSSNGGSGNGHGNDGANAAWMNWGGGGGAGAGANGSNGNGGNGVEIPTQYIPSDYGTPGPGANPGRWFAGGGGGGHGDPSGSGDTPTVTGGAGGGGRGEVGNPSGTLFQTATDGTANTGGGGGGKDLHDNATPVAGAGGSGIVFIFHD